MSKGMHSTVQLFFFMIIIQYSQYSPPACPDDLLFSFSFSYCTQLSSVRECSNSYVLKPPCDLQVTRLTCQTNNSESLNSWINPADTLSPRNFETNPVTSAKDPRSSLDSSNPNYSQPKIIVVVL